MRRLLLAAGTAASLGLHPAAQSPATVTIALASRGGALHPLAVYRDKTWQAPADEDARAGSWHKVPVEDEQFAEVAIAGRATAVGFERATSEDRAIVDEVASDVRRAERQAAESWNANAAGSDLAMQYPVLDADRSAARLNVHAFVRTAGKIDGRSWWYVEGEKRYPREVRYEWSDRPCQALSRVRGVLLVGGEPRQLRQVITDAEASDDCSADTTTVPLVALVIRSETFWVVRRESGTGREYALTHIVNGLPEPLALIPD